MKKIIVTVGCRPDRIKMMPLVKELRKREEIEVKLLNMTTRQIRKKQKQLLIILFVTPIIG